MAGVQEWRKMVLRQKVECWSEHVAVLYLEAVGMAQP